MIKFQFIFVFLLAALSTIHNVHAAKSWRVATTYPGNYEKKDPLRNMPEDPQSKLQKHMARMNRVFDPKRRQKDTNNNVEKAKAKLKRKARMDVRGNRNKKRKGIPPRPRKPAFAFPGSKRQNKDNFEFPIVPSTSWYNS
ncbi:MAG: hypothetical protein SGILL_007289 [Bacillariaceae sp.]